MGYALSILQAQAVAQLTTKFAGLSLTILPPPFFPWLPTPYEVEMDFEWTPIPSYKIPSASLTTSPVTIPSLPILEKDLAIEAELDSGDGFLNKVADEPAETEKEPLTTPFLLTLDECLDIEAGLNSDDDNDFLNEPATTTPIVPTLHTLDECRGTDLGLDSDDNDLLEDIASEVADTERRIKEKEAEELQTEPFEWEEAVPRIIIVRHFLENGVDWVPFGGEWSGRGGDKDDIF